MASILKRVSPRTEAIISKLAKQEDRSFVAQLDRIVDAGLKAEGIDPATVEIDTPLQATG